MLFVLLPLSPLLLFIAETFYKHPQDLYKRSINIELMHPVQKRINLTKKTQQQNIVYLTFDDGPLNGSENIDSVVLAEKLKVSVFLVGAHVQKSRTMENYCKFYTENPFIDEYNHSYTHANDRYQQFYSNTKAVVADVEKNQLFLKLQYKIVRLPGRNMWRVGGRTKDDVKSGSAAADLLAARGYKVIGWDLEWMHNPKTAAPVQTVDEIEHEIENKLKQGETFTPGNIVILLHDEMFQKKWQESELRLLMERLREKGYVFEQIRFYPS